MIEAVPVAVSGNPDPSKICPSHVERQNLTMRMQIRRLTRLTNAFSKKIENHVYAFALHTMYHNFVKISGAHRMTPVQAAGVDSRLWEIGDIVKVVETWEAEQVKLAA